MDVILSTAFGVKAGTQIAENDPITEFAKKATSPKPIVGLCKSFLFGVSSFFFFCKFVVYVYHIINMSEYRLCVTEGLKISFFVLLKSEENANERKCFVKNV